MTHLMEIYGKIKLIIVEALILGLPAERFKISSKIHGLKEERKSTDILCNARG